MSRLEFVQIGHQIIGSDHPRLVRDTAVKVWEFELFGMDDEVARSFWLTVLARQGVSGRSVI